MQRLRWAMCIELRCWLRVKIYSEMGSLFTPRLRIRPTGTFTSFNDAKFLNTTPFDGLK